MASLAAGRGLEANKLWVVKRINLFHQLDRDERQLLLSRGEARSFQRRQVVFTPKDRGDAVHLILQGRIKLSRFDERGREIILAILEDGEIFGEEALTPDELRRGYAEALEETRILRIPRADFEQLLQRDANLARHLARHMAERLLAAQEQLEALAFQDVAARLRAVLLRLAEEHGEILEDGKVRIQLRLTQQELAAMVASTRETVSTLLGRLKEQELIEVDGRSIVVLPKARHWTPR